MTKDEFFEQEYILNDRNYLKYYCHDSVEEYFLEKELNAYDRDLWLFESKPDYGLEDDYGEESEPQSVKKKWNVVERATSFFFVQHKNMGSA